MKTHLLILSSLLLVACSTMSQKECLVANWSDLGFTDGSAGYALSYFSERASDCNKHGIAVNRSAYVNGRQAGLAQYCTKEQGYQQGSHGYTYQSVCQGKAAKQFLSGYAKGKEIYEKNQNLKKLQSRLLRAENNLSNLQTRQYDIEAQIVNESDKAKRAALILELNHNRREITQLKQKQQSLQYQYRQAKRTLDTSSQ